VGDGTKIGIWTDKWVEKAPGGYLQSPTSIIDRNAKVSVLLDINTNWWNVALIKEIFSAEESDLICGIAVSPRGGEDRRIWKFNKSGDFTVKSAYHLAKEKFEVDKGNSSNRDRIMPLWKVIWNIEVPRAAKSFLWKACSGILPTKDKVYKRKISSDPLCPICCTEEETIVHSLWDCIAA
jgi:hypothetical protein